MLTCLIVRVILGCLNALSLVYYAESARKAFGKTTAIWFVLLQASQFHVIYYASRPLPNMSAFGLSM
jgi:alpha-1,6-mannosyltransferase